MPSGSPKLRAIFLLRCPYCLETKLRMGKSWFQFEKGCTTCDYRYERELGYFSGVPWMITYPIVGILMLLLVSIFYDAQSFNALKLASIISAVAVGGSVILYPFSRVIWLVGDHLINPLTEQDQLKDS